MASSQLETCNYVAGQATGLKELVQASDLPFLAYLLGMVEQEAVQQYSLLLAKAGAETAPLKRGPKGKRYKTLTAGKTP